LDWIDRNGLIDIANVKFLSDFPLLLLVVCLLARSRIHPSTYRITHQTYHQTIGLHFLLF